ncbi:hypothetical protein R2A130_0504 [Ahrensia sp. R2A130]|nr:hypothetical protein R2A130_0504 [Ahrensia sp. R2A130]
MVFSSSDLFAADLFDCDEAKLGAGFFPDKLVKLAVRSNYLN